MGVPEHTRLKLCICSRCVGELMTDAAPEIQERVAGQEKRRGKCEICGNVGPCWTSSSRRDVVPFSHDPALGPPHWDGYLQGCRCRDCHRSTVEMIALLQES